MPPPINVKPGSEIHAFREGHRDRDKRIGKAREGECI
jgi:hypothetical protein